MPNKKVLRKKLNVNQKNFLSAMVKSIEIFYIGLDEKKKIQTKTSVKKTFQKKYYI